MSSCDRRFLLLAPLALAACGFQPVYAPGGSGTRLQNRVQVSEPNDRSTYLLVRQIEERLGRATDPAYNLTLNLSTWIAGLGIDPAGNTNRYNLIGLAGYTLSDISSGQAIVSGSINNFTGYFAAGSTVQTLAAERDARERLMVIIGDQLVARLLAADIPE